MTGQQLERMRSRYYMADDCCGCYVIPAVPNSPLFWGVGLIANRCLVLDATSSETDLPLVSRNKRTFGPALRDESLRLHPDAS